MRFRSLSPILFALVLASTLLAATTSVHALGGLTLTIESATGGETNPVPGTYYYQQVEQNLDVQANAFSGYYLGGWYMDGNFWNTTENPIHISLNNPNQVSLTVRPYFSTISTHTLTLTSVHNVYVKVNGVSVYAGGGTKTVLEGSSITVGFEGSIFYHFVNFLVNGTDTVTNNPYTFIMYGNTAIFVNETYEAPSGGTSGLLLTIQTADGGYTSPYTGQYYYPQSETTLTVTAYPNDGYFLMGWYTNGNFWNTTENPIQISLNNPANVSMTLKPAFSTTPYYSLTLYSPDNVYINVNNVGTYTSSTGFIKGIKGGSTVVLSWPTSQWYAFTSYTINGTQIVTTPTYSFVMNGDTSVFVSEVYVPPNTGGGATDFMSLAASYIAPSIIIGAMGVSLSQIGDKLGEHKMAGFLIGGTIGLVVCANSGLVPIWFVASVFLCGIVAVYFWFRSGD